MTKPVLKKEGWTEEEDQKNREKYSDVLKKESWEFIIRMILEMRFGDGTGTDPQIQLATREIVAEIDQAKQESKQEVIEEIKNLEKEMVEGAGYMRMHELVLDILSHLQSGEKREEKEEG